MNDIRLGERLSFYQLINNKNYNIEIPIIQRDYVQGRVEQEDIQNDFIDALKKYLDDNIANRDLDFVYGSLFNNNFIPLDGQQRLTTLFLLHWYIAIKENKFNDFAMWVAIEKSSNNKISRFSYKTRTSSQLFCDLLVNTSVDLLKLLDDDNNRNSQGLLSKTLKDKSGFYLSWKNDPTISSMLNMLDVIHEKFKDSEIKENYYERLTSNDKPIITFLMLNLNEFNLSDDLYIKMNSRGMPLTTFENFKAKLLQHIKEELTFPNKRMLIIENSEVEVSTAKYFSYNIDTKWSNLFWAYTKNTENKGIDKKIMNFIRFCIVSTYATSNKYDKNVEFLLSTQKEFSVTNKISFNKYLEINSITTESVNFIIDSLNILVNNDDTIKVRLKPDFQYYFNEVEIFEKLISYNLSMVEHIRVYAYLKFLLINNEDNTGLNDWMRVVFNLTENVEFDKAEDYVKGISEIDRLISEVNNGEIITALRSNINIKFFYERQVQEEKIKANLFEKPAWKDVIFDMEKHSYFKGQILFIFEYSGVLEYFEINNNCDWVDSENDEYFNAFNDYVKKVKSVFIDNPNKIENYLWAKAVLSKGNYLLGASADRFNLLTTSKNLRDYSWKRILRLPPHNYSGKVKWHKKRKLIKEVFDDKDFDSKNIVDSLDKIRNNHKPSGWRMSFIERPEFMNYCKQGFIMKKANGELLLYKESQSNHTHLEFYTYLLYLDKIVGKSFTPFTNSFESATVAYDKKPCVVIDKWNFNKSNYAINIRYLLKGNYEIRFFDRELPQKYDPRIIDILQKRSFKLDFKYNDDSYIAIYNESEVISTINNLCVEFNKLI